MITQKILRSHAGLNGPISADADSDTVIGQGMISPFSESVST
jgi:hypothetical protein